MKYNLIVFGTRPELIKLIPVILEIRNRSLESNYKILCTCQHKELINDLLDLFNIEPDIKLPINNIGLSISESLSNIVKELENYISENKSHIGYIIGQGDTTSCMAAAMVAFLNKIPFAHIEAGLRTFDQENPFPEEYFRQIISLSTTIHFTPTNRAKENLLNENIPAEKILHTGNTIVDVLSILNNIQSPVKNESIRKFLKTNNNAVITCHRRENQNGNFDSLVNTIKELANSHPKLNFIWLSHLNPFVNSKLKNESLNGIHNIYIIKPINIFGMIDLYKSSKLIITDSGGIQEEAVSFNVPTIVIREKTERQEAVEIGNSIVVGNSSEKLKLAFNRFLIEKTSPKENPFGDGKAAFRIIDYLEQNTMNS